MARSRGFAGRGFPPGALVQRPGPRGGSRRAPRVADSAQADDREEGIGEWQWPVELPDVHSRRGIWIAEKILTARGGNLVCLTVRRDCRAHRLPFA